MHRRGHERRCGFAARAFQFNVEAQFVGADRGVGTFLERPEIAGEVELLLVGDGDFASNSFFHILGNGALFLNGVSYLAEQEQLIDITPSARAILGLVRRALIHKQFLMINAAM